MATATVPAHLASSVEQLDPELLKGAFVATAKLIAQGTPRLEVMDRMVASGIPNNVATWAYSQVRDKGPDLELAFERSEAYTNLELDRGSEYWTQMNRRGWLKFLPTGVALVLMAILIPPQAAEQIGLIPVLVAVVALLSVHLWGLADIAESRGYPRIYALFSIAVSSLVMVIYFSLVPKRHTF